jgi:S-formylglutathione hydrolase FrmB
MAGFVLRNLSIVDWEVRAAIAGTVVLLVVASFVLLRRRPVLRWSARAACLPLAVLFAGAAVNAHYYYFPTLGALLGRNAVDQVSGSTFQQMLSRLRTSSGAHGRARSAHAVTLPSHGIVIPFQMPGTVSHFSPRTGEVYLPPVWFQLPHPHLPVIELLHGSPGSPADWTRGSRADLTADEYAAAHDGYAPILVMPDVNGAWRNDSECVDGPRGMAETYLRVDVRNAVVRTFAARADGASWGIAGLSEGGSCALQMGLRHPDDFRVVGDFSGDDHPWAGGGLRSLFWGSTPSEVQRAEASYDPRVLLANRHPSRGPAIAFAIGRSDHLQPKLERLYAAALRDGLPATYATYPGGHEFRLWGNCLAGAFPWMVSFLDRSAPAPRYRHVTSRIARTHAVKDAGVPRYLYRFPIQRT